jgi:hypothetical protein
MAASVLSRSPEVLTSTNKMVDMLKAIAKIEDRINIAKSKVTPSWF